MEIREFRVGDLAAIHAINEGEVPAVGSVSLDQLGALIDQSLIALVADDDGTVGGFTIVLPPDADYASPNFAWFRERYDDFIYLDRVAIAPDFQRRGLGHRFYAEVERLTAERRPSANEFALEVNLEPRNEKSLAFHDQLGFVEVGVRAPSSDYRVTMMMKPLAGGGERFAGISP